MKLQIEAFIVEAYAFHFIPAIIKVAPFHSVQNDTQIPQIITEIDRSWKTRLYSVPNTPEKQKVPSAKCASNWKLARHPHQEAYSFIILWEKDN